MLVCDPVSFDCCAVPIASITVDNSKIFYLSITVDIFVYIVNSGYFVYVRCIDFRYDHKNKAA